MNSLPYTNGLRKVSRTLVQFAVIFAKWSLAPEIPPSLRGAIANLLDAILLLQQQNHEKSPREWKRLVQMLNARVMETAGTLDTIVGFVFQDLPKEARQSAAFAKAATMLHYDLFVLSKRIDQLEIESSDEVTAVLEKIMAFLASVIMHAGDFFQGAHHLPQNMKARLRSTHSGPAFAHLCVCSGCCARLQSVPFAASLYVKATVYEIPLENDNF